MPIALQTPFTFGDSNNASRHFRAAPQVLELQSSLSFTRLGDTWALLGHARGGNDSLRGSVSSSSTNVVVVLGDAVIMSDDAQGGDDVVYSDAFGQAFAVGDADTMSRLARGGDDFVS